MVPDQASIPVPDQAVELTHAWRREGSPPRSTEGYLVINRLHGHSHFIFSLGVRIAPRIQSSKYNNPPVHKIEFEPFSHPTCHTCYAMPN